MTAILVLLTILAFLAVDLIKTRLARRSEAAERRRSLEPFGEVRLPLGLFLGKQHTWARLTEIGELKLGVDELLTQAVGGVEDVDLPEVGIRVKAGDPIATIRRDGRSLEVVSPVSGTVVVTNNDVERAPMALRNDPYGSGWLVTIWPDKHDEVLANLMIGKQAMEWLKHEVQRLRDFLSAKAAPEALGHVLADGAHPVVGAAMELDDEGWEEFKQEFTR